MKLRNVLRRVGVFSDHVKFNGSTIPSPDKRWCGAKFRDDSYYLQSAENEARRLVENFSCNSSSRVLDIGCGQGRLAIGLARIIGELPYIGLDVDEWSIRWCQKHIHSSHPSYTFERINVFNERYNRLAAAQPDTFRFGLKNESVDLAYLYSVFSHMEERDMRAYLSEIHRMLTENGNLFFTTFVEENVEDFSINPPGYIFQKNSGALHVVRFRKNYLLEIVESAGFEIIGFSHGTEADEQSAIYAKKR